MTDLWRRQITELAAANAELAELTDLLQRVDRLEFNGGTRWLYYDEADTKLWYVREEFRRDSREVWHGPSLLDGLRALVEGKKAQS